MVKLYIQKETSEKDIDEIVVDTTHEDRFKLCNWADGELKIESEDHEVSVWISYDNIDLFIEALNKAKELWGSK